MESTRTYGWDGPMGRNALRSRVVESGARVLVACVLVPARKEVVDGGGAEEGCAEGSSA